MNAWDGKDRRRTDLDHDILIEIRSDLKNFLKVFKEHVEEDKKDFQRLFDRTSTLQKFMWLLMGAFVTVQVLAQLSQ